MTYDPAGNKLGEADAKIAPNSRGLPDQLQGRYSHLVLRNPLVTPELFSMRRVKPNADLDAKFEAYRAIYPVVELDLLKRVLDQQLSGIKRGNFKKIWTAYRTEKFSGGYNETP